MSVAWPNFLDWQERQTSFESLAAWRGLTANLTGIDQPRRLNVRQVTWNLLSMLGVRADHGPRLHRRTTTSAGVPRTALVSYAFWQRELGGTLDALGRQIMLDESPVTVIGVLPRGIHDCPPGRHLPARRHLFSKARILQMYNGRGNHFGFAAIGRFEAGRHVETANTEMVTIARQLEQEYPATNSGNGASVEPAVRSRSSHDARQMLYVLLGAVITMLLIACVNLANLMLSRAAGRAQEMAVRRSLGAARWRIARQMLTESVLLAIIGGTIGVLRCLRGFRGARRLAAAESAAHPHHHHRLARAGGRGPCVDWHRRAVRTDARDPGRHRAIDDVAPQRARHRHRAKPAPARGARCCSPKSRWRWCSSPAPG